jgi:antitoxin (DNA-binding transcriptional repressor) of toxin-antitoxin stability system
MKAVGIKILKNKLSEYVRLAASGETILVTDRDTVVAEIGPPRAGRADTAGDALLAEIVRKGWLRPPLTGKSRPSRKPVQRWTAIEHELADDRADR